LPLGPTLRRGPGFSFEAQRLVEPFGPLVMAALRQAGLEPEAEISLLDGASPKEACERYLRVY
jgi:hypothetical protein